MRGSMKLGMLLAAGAFSAVAGISCGSSSKGNSSTGANPPQTTSGQGGTKLPSPTFAKTVNLAPLSGKVLIKLPSGRAFTTLDSGRQVPVGTEIDVRAGVVHLTVATPVAAPFYDGDFQSGVFAVLQNPSEGGLTDLRIQNDAAVRAGCGRTPARVSHHRLSKREFGRLIGDATGRFRTQGEFSAATVRGTNWGVRDLCDGTLTIVRRGVVLVDDFTQHKEFVVRAGQTHLAPAG